MRIGQLRHQIAIQSATLATDAYGQESKTWATAASVWGRIEPLTGRELERAKLIRADLDHKVTLRGGTTVSETDRIVYASRTLEIVNVVNVEERDRMLVLYCVEVRAGG